MTGFNKFNLTRTLMHEFMNESLGELDEAREFLKARVGNYDGLITLINVAESRLESYRPVNAMPGSRLCDRCAALLCAIDIMAETAYNDILSQGVSGDDTTFASCFRFAANDFRKLALEFKDC